MDASRSNHSESATKKFKSFLISFVVVLFIISLLLIFLATDTDKPSDIEKICITEGGIWVNDDCVFYDKALASELKASCEDFNGRWIEESYSYECEIDGVIFSNGEWEFKDFEWLDEISDVCLELDGEFVGGTALECIIDGESYYYGQWMLLKEMKTSCLEYSGEWLGGQAFKCEIEGRIYEGNWEQAIHFVETCENLGGVWIGEENACRINGHTYKDGSWNKLRDMELSCLRYGGEFLAGPGFDCRIQGETYSNQEWESIFKALTMKEICENEGGSWFENNKECRGLSFEWCTKLVSRIDEVNALSWNEETLSCYVYD